MKVHKAETGQLINWHSTAKIIQNVNDLKEEIEKDTGVPVEDQILMTDFGKLVRNENLPQILQSVGKDEFIVFCYDRRYLSAEKNDIEALVDSETPPLESAFTPFNGSSLFTQFKNSLKKTLSPDEICNAYLSLFVKFESYNQLIQRTVNAHSKLAKLIVKEQKMQGMALQVAMTNLESHTKLSEACIQLFVSKAEKEYYKQQSLLTSLNDDLTILGKVEIHPAISKIISPDHLQKKTLVDFVDLKYIDTVRKDTINLSNYLSTHIALLKKEMKELNSDEDNFRDQVHISSELQSLDSTLADIQSLEQELQKTRVRTNRDFLRVCEKIAKLLNKPMVTLLDSLPASLDVEPPLSSSVYASGILSVSKVDTTNPLDRKRAFESMNHLAEFHIIDYIPTLEHYEHAIRQKTMELIMAKRKAIRTFIVNMAIVSKFEQHVGKIQPSVNEHMQYLDEFKDKYNGQDLETLRHILFAYGAIMIELLRRKEYSNMLIENTGLVTEAFSAYKTDEEDRREYFRRVISKSFIFKPMNSILDRAAPKCEVSIVGTIDHDGNELHKRDISEFISLITQVYSSSPELLHSKKRTSHRLLSKSSTENKSKLFSKTLQDEEKFLSLLREMLNEMDDMQDRFLSIVNESVFKNKKVQVASSRPYEAVNREFSQLNLTQGTQKTILPVSVHLDSSTYSVVEDEKKILTENKQLKYDLKIAKENIDLLEKTTQEQTDEISHLRDIIKKLESEKEEFESQRQSFLKELESKDKTHDIHVQAIEEGLKAQVNDMQYKYDEEKRMKENLEIEYASEIESLRTEYSEKTEQLNIQILQESKKSSSLTDEKEKLKEQLQQLNESINTMKEELETERTTHALKLAHLQQDLEGKVTEEIRSLQQQTRIMVTRAQDDWEQKNEELKKMRKEQEATEIVIKDLLQRFRPDGPELNRLELDAHIKSFKKNLEEFEHEYNMTKENLNTVSKELADVTNGYTSLIDVHNEWRTIASVMADKLDEYRKQVIFEIVNQLQLPMEEEELNVLQKRLTPSDDDSLMWNEILQLTSSIDTQKFVHRVHQRVKDNYEQAKNYKKEYKVIKEKYNKLCTVYCEKIAFRNFKVGDVALFLPTKNVLLGKAWAAFNINAPCYFLKSTPDNSLQMANREWIVARITNITEHIADANNPESVEYGVTAGTKYQLLEVENWKTHRHRVSKKRHISRDNDSSLPSTVLSSTFTDHTHIADLGLTSIN